MPFDHTLRERLHREAASVTLPEREPRQAVARAHRRRRHRSAVLGAAAVAAMVAAVSLATGGGGDGTADVDVASVAGLLPRTGALTFDWQVGDSGLGTVSSSFQAADGTVYALSTGPGFRGLVAGEWPRALYRLGAGGTWEPVELEGDRPRAADVTANGDALYAVSTSPAAGGGGSVARVSTSTDRGDTWSGEDLPAVASPSDEVPWLQDHHVSVETAGDTTIAVVTTSFRLDLAAFPELDPSGWVEEGEDGLVVHAPEDDVELDRLTWNELGLSGPDDLDPAHQVLRSTGDGWELVDGVTGLTGDSLTLGAAGDRFIVGTVGAGGTTVLTSSDGAGWVPVEVPGSDPWMVSVGPALVALDLGTSTVHASGDLGGSWQQVDLSGSGVPPGFIVQSIDSGPLGVALVLTGPDGWDPQLVVSGDLVDWTVTPIAEVVGARPNTTIGVTVGADRLVVTATLPPSVPGGVSDSRTAVGTPVRG